MLLEPRTIDVIVIPDWKRYPITNNIAIVETPWLY